MPTNLCTKGFFDRIGCHSRRARARTVLREHWWIALWRDRSRQHGRKTGQHGGKTENDDDDDGLRIRRRISLESAILIGGPRRRTGTSLERPLLKESAIGVVFVERIRSGADFDGTVVPRNFA